MTRALVLAAAVGGMALSACDTRPPVGRDIEAANPCLIDASVTPRRVTILAARFPATEHFAREMQACSHPPLLTIDVQMLPPEQVKRQADLAMSSGAASPFDIIHVNPDKVAEQAAKGWVYPLDALVERYRDRYRLDDIPSSFWQPFRFGEHLYAVPFIGNVQVLFYRRDLFERYGQTPPRTVEEWYAVADRLSHVPEVRYPLALALRGGLLTQEFSNALMVSGGRWYDEHGDPAFASLAGVHAVEMLARLRDFGPRAMLSFTNDDAMVALLQNQVAMANIWLSRGVEMGNPLISNVIGKIAYAASPGLTPDGVPYGSLGFDGWVIPANAPNPDLAFRIIMEGSDAASMLGAASFGVAARRSVAEADDVIRDAPWLPAGSVNLARGATALPAVATFSRMATAIQPALARGLADRLPATVIVSEMNQAARRLLDEQRSFPLRRP